MKGYGPYFPLFHARLDRGGIKVWPYRRTLAGFVVGKDRRSDVLPAFIDLVGSFHADIRFKEFGEKGFCVYFDPILKHATMRVTVHRCTGRAHVTRWDFWDPRTHMEFLSWKGFKRTGIEIFKGKGAVILPDGIYQLDACDWRVWRMEDMVFKIGAPLAAAAA